MKHRDKILELRLQGKSYKQIVAILGCSIGTISYHCGNEQKLKTTKRKSKFNKSAHPYLHKLYRFTNKYYQEKKAKDKLRSNLQKQLRDKLYDFYKKGSAMDSKITLEQLIEKFGEQTNCYLTGQPIDIYQPSTYEFDHIIPTSRGGDNSIDNLGIADKRVNQAKRDMTPDEFINLCKQVLTHNGYQVTKAEATRLERARPEDPLI